MGIIIQITEKDILDYVLQPERLSAEKIHFIEQEKSLLDKIKYYKELKKSLQGSETGDNSPPNKRNPNRSEE